MNVVDPNRYDGHELISKVQIGEWLHAKPKAVHLWLYRHKIQPVDMPGRARYFRAADVKAVVSQPRSTRAAA